MAEEQQEQPEKPAASSTEGSRGKGRPGITGKEVERVQKERGAQRASVEYTRVRRWVKVPKKKLTPAMQAKVIQRKERMAKALELRKAAANYKQIGDALGVSESYARRLTIQAMNEVVIDDAKEVIMMDLLRLDEMQMLATRALRQGDLNQTERIMRIMRERRDILGLTTDSWREQQAERSAQGITNNGIMVVQGSSENFVEAMMRAVGVDPNSQEAQERLKRIREEEEKKGTGEFALQAPRPNDLLMAAADSALNQSEGERKVIQGEIIAPALDEESI